MNSLAVQRLGLRAFTAEGPGSIPGRGTNIPQAAQCNQKNKKQSKQTNKTHIQEAQRTPNRINPRDPHLDIP